MFGWCINYLVHLIAIYFIYLYKLSAGLEISAMSSAVGSWKILFGTEKNEVVHIENFATWSVTVIFKAITYAVFAIGKKEFYIAVDEMQRLVFSDIDFKFARDIQVCALSTT